MDNGEAIAMCLGSCHDATEKPQSLAHGPRVTRRAESKTGPQKTEAPPGSP